MHIKYFDKTMRKSLIAMQLKNFTKNNNFGIEACAPGKNYHAAKAEAIIKQIQRCANSALTI